MRRRLGLQSDPIGMQIPLAVGAVVSQAEHQNELDDLRRENEILRESQDRIDILIQDIQAKSDEITNNNKKLSQTNREYQNQIKIYEDEIKKLLQENESLQRKLGIRVNNYSRTPRRSLSSRLSSLLRRNTEENNDEVRVGGNRKQLRTTKRINKLHKSKTYRKKSKTYRKKSKTYRKKI